MRDFILGTEYRYGIFFLLFGSKIEQRINDAHKKNIVNDCFQDVF
jgi:hypothetical protein